MSTKIYKGFKLDTSDLGQILAFVEKARPQFVSLAEEVMDEFVGQGPDVDKRLEAWGDRRRSLEQNRIRDVAVDTDFEIVFFPVPNQLGITLGIVFAERESWYEQWLKLPGVSEYAYWDNTDKPKKVSAKAWEERRVLWNKVLPGAGIPAMSGFSIKVVHPMGPLPKHWRRQEASPPTPDDKPAAKRRP